MKFKSIEELKKEGFIGFVSINELWRDASCISREKGIYFVLYVNDGMPIFLEKGCGGLFKGKNPNVSLRELRENWVVDTPVIYIGKAGGKTSLATLYRRLSQYLKFGQGENVGHWGGRYIWQIENAGDLLICWKPVEDPEEMERELIQSFKKEYSGKRPFANLRD
ncbi:MULTISPECIES: hypothetical protein [Butyricimonas]|uniref:hypothetical protein n=1 Tax=Butyricimonas TaxID=574697 RepID=UPI0007FB444A|nr:MULTISPECIES: hypothetical protein [Butyricimonas]